MNKNNLFFIDFETGGLRHYTNGVCSFNIQNQQEYNKTLYFYPEKKVYEFQALQVNGFSFEELYDKGESRDLLINLLYNLHSNSSYKYLVLCGWNVGFDIDFLNQIYKDKKLSFPCPILSLDLKQIAEDNIKKKDKRKKEDTGVENHKLVTIYQHFFEDFDEELAHTADYDVYMTKKLYEKFVNNGWIDEKLIFISKLAILI